MVNGMTNYKHLKFLMVKIPKLFLILKKNELKENRPEGKLTSLLSYEI